jgi:hypothetical protein
MKQLIFLISTLVFFFSCAPKAEKSSVKNETLSIVKNHKIQVDSIFGQELEKLIHIPIRNKFNEKYNGYYQITTNQVGDTILDGKFQFIHFDSIAIYDQSITRISKIEYGGTYTDGKKNGEFTENFLIDDGIDLYSKWIVSLDYKDNNCSTGIFKGIFGYIMKETTYQFNQLDNCTFQSVVEKASQLWKEEYEKSNN